MEYEGYKRYKKLCDDRGISSYKVSQETGVSTATISSWGRGRYKPKADKLQKLADYFGVPVELFHEKKKKHVISFDSSALQKAIGQALEKDTEFNAMINSLDQMYKIPVVRRVAAGIPIDSQEELIGYEGVSEYMDDNDVYFGLQIQGDSMEPGIRNGDIVIVRQQDTAEDGEIVVALINGNDGVCKRLKKYEDGSIALMSDNPQYQPLYFNGAEIDTVPIRICGIVKELRRKFQ